MRLATEGFGAPLGDETRHEFNPNWRRAWFVDVANRYAGHISGLRIGFIEVPEFHGEWRCYAINRPCTVANDLPRLFAQAKELFDEALARERTAEQRLNTSRLDTSRNRFEFGN